MGRRTLVSWRPLSSRGYLTYSIYMLHTVVATIVIAVLPRIFGTSPWATAGLVTFAALVTFCLAELSYRYFETPLRGAINRWPRRRKKGVVEGWVPTDADGPRIAAAD
jgi:peptidoglycan/LPS O-acetylase OafA/YrhL